MNPLTISINNYDNLQQEYKDLLKRYYSFVKERGYNNLKKKENERLLYIFNSFVTGITFESCFCSASEYDRFNIIWIKILDGLYKNIEETNE